MNVFIGSINGWPVSACATFEDARDEMFAHPTAVEAARTNGVIWVKAVDALDEHLREAGWACGAQYATVVERVVKVPRPAPSDSMFGVKIVTSQYLPPGVDCVVSSKYRQVLEQTIAAAGEPTGHYNRNPEGAEPPEGWTSPHGLPRVQR